MKDKWAGHEVASEGLKLQFSVYHLLLAAILDSST